MASSDSAERVASAFIGFFFSRPGLKAFIKAGAASALCALARAQAVMTDGEAAGTVADALGMFAETENEDTDEVIQSLLNAGAPSA